MQQFTVKHTVIDGKVNSFTVNYEGPQESGEIAKQYCDTLFLFVLDKSGSMAGSFEAVVEQVIDLAENVSNKQFICYADQAHVMNENVLKTMKAGGQTNFIRAFTAIEQTILAQNRAVGTDVVVVFFTDGQDTCNRPETLQPSLNTFKTFLAKNTRSTTIHCVGYTSEHHVQFLNQLSGLGSLKGTFTYIRDKQSIDELAGLQAVCKVTKTIEFKQFPTALLVSLVLYNDTATVYLERLVGAAESQPVIIYNGKEIQPPVIKRECTTLDQVKYLEYKAEQISRGLSRPEPLSTEELDSLLTSAKTLDTELTGLVTHDKLFKSKTAASTDRKEIMQIHKNVKDIVSKILAVGTELAKGKVTNDKLAALLSTAYSSITKRGLVKKLNKRIQGNLKSLENSDALLEQEVNGVNGIDFKQLVACPAVTPKLQASLDDYTCFMSTCNWVELLKDKDALGVSICISRSQSAIAEPTRINVYKVNTSYISIQSLLNCVQYGLDILVSSGGYNNDNNSDDDNTGKITGPAAIHGGFDRKNRDANVLVNTTGGVYRESITGVFPLYIHKDHFKIAKILSKPLFGWMTTLDIAGYEYAQTKAIPFVVIAHMVREMIVSPETVSDKYISIFLNVMRTTRAIIDWHSGPNVPDGRKSMQQEFNDTIDAFTLNPLARTPDVVPNLEVLLAQSLFVGGGPTRFWTAFLEEYIRRQCTWLFKNIKEREIILNVLTKMYADAPQSGEIPQSKAPISVLEDEMQVSVIDHVLHKVWGIPLIPFGSFWHTYGWNTTVLWDAIDKNYGIVPDSCIKDLKNLLLETKPATALQELKPKQLFVSVKHLSFEYLTTQAFGSCDIDKRWLFAMVLQAIKYRDNKDFRDYASKPDYSPLIYHETKEAVLSTNPVDCIWPPHSKSAKNQMYVIDSIITEWVTFENREREKEYAEKIKFKAAYDFVMADDLNVACDLFDKECIHFGNPMFRKVLYNLRFGDVVRPHDKINMLTTGQFTKPDGTTVVFYTSHSNCAMTWKPGRRYRNLFKRLFGWKDFVPCHVAETCGKTNPISTLSSIAPSV